MAWDLPATVTAATDRTAAYMNKYKSCFDALDQHTHSGTDGDGSALLDQPMARYHQVVLPFFYNAGGQFTTYTVNSVRQGYLVNSPAADGDEVAFDIYLYKPGGNYTLLVPTLSDSDCGKIQLYINGSTFGSLSDVYAASPTWGQLSFSLTPSTITANGLYTFKIKVNGKNASSSGYKAKIGGLVFRNTVLV